MMTTKQLLDVQLDELHVDPDAQRTLNVKRAKKMADNWQEVWAGAITVGKDPNGKFYVCDGQTRVAAAQMAELSTIAAVIFDPVTQQERPRCSCTSTPIVSV